MHMLASRARVITNQDGEGRYSEDQHAETCGCLGANILIWTDAQGQLLDLKAPHTCLLILTFLLVDHLQYR